MIDGDKGIACSGIRGPCLHPPGSGPGPEVVRSLHLAEKHDEGLVCRPAPHPTTEKGRMIRHRLSQSGPAMTVQGGADPAGGPPPGVSPEGDAPQDGSGGG